MTRRWSWVLALAVNAAACLLLSFEVLRPGFSLVAFRPLVVTFVTLAVLAFVAEWLAFQMPGLGTVSLSFVAVFAGLALGGPLMGAAVAAAGAIPPQDILDRKPLPALLFNFGQLAFSALGAGILVSSIGLTNGSHLGLPLESGLAAVVATGVVALALYLLNYTLVVAYLTMGSAQPFLRTWLSGVSRYALNFVVLAALGLLLAQTIALVGPFGIALIGVPFVVARHTFLSYSELVQAYDDVLRLLSDAVESKDIYTRGHSERVAEYARLLAEAVGLDSESVETVRTAGLLHDVGKVVVPVEVLRKPGRLTDAEYDSIKLHPLSACTILEGLDSVAALLPGIRWHHERPDGTGYPDGLSMEDLPLEARILSVADCFDAMTSSRPYKSALTFEDAAAELRRFRDTQFDARLVDAFLDGPLAAALERILGEQTDGAVEGLVAVVHAERSPA